MQACGVSVARLLRPVGVIAVAGWAATSYVMLEALPDANQAFREITFNVLAPRAEGEVKPRVFFEDFPDLVLYVRDIPPTGGWNDVFMADSRPGQTPAIYLARHGRVILDPQTRTVRWCSKTARGHSVDRRRRRIRSSRSTVWCSASTRKRCFRAAVRRRAIPR